MDVKYLQDQDEIIALLEDIMAKIERGEPFKATLRVRHLDGTHQVLDIGYESDEERDAALAKILKFLGELH